MLTSAKKVHSDIMQNIDSKFTKGMDDAFTTLNNVNSSSKPYKSKYTKKTVPKKVLAGYKADGTSVYIDSTEVKSYTLSEILDGKASPIQAAKAVYDDRIKAVKEMMAKKDQLSDEEIKALEGKTAEEVVAVRYPGQLPDYQRLKASRYYEENKESLQYVDMGIKALAVLVMVGGTVLAGPTGGTSLTATYAAGTYLAADSAYSAIKGHTMITGTQLTTEERIWAGIDSAVTIASMGSAGYLAKLAKSGKNGSTLLKNLATAGKHADDVNDFTKVAYAVGTGKDPSSDIQNLMFGQIMGFGMKSAGNYIGKKFGAPSVDVPGTKPSHLDVPLQTKQIPNLDPDSVRFNSRQDLHLKASPADTTFAKLKNHPAVSLDLPKMKRVSGDSATKAIGGIKPSDVDVPKVKGELAQSTHGSATTSVESVTPKELIPGTPEHKAQRWKEYQARDNAGWSYERWSKQYDINMENASYGLSRERKYREVFGGKSRVLKTDFTLRQIDIADGTSLKQLKTGKVSLTKQAKIDIQKDAWLIDEGYHVEYILEKGASKPFLNALDENNIPYTIGSLLDN